MSRITTHILDTSLGRPAASVAVRLDHLASGQWTPVGGQTTNADGRAVGLTPEGRSLEKGLYRLTFATGAYFRSRGVATFYPEVSVQFEVADPDQHYHVPLLLNPFGYSTYRGS